MTTAGSTDHVSATARDIPTPAGVVTLRPERAEDRDFRHQLFCDSRPQDFARVLPPDVFRQLMAQQFEAQTISYQRQFPQARFDIAELAGRPIGRIVVDRPGSRLHIVDQAIIPELRSRGIGSAIMRALMEEARGADLPVQLEVADENDPSLRLYLRLGFVPIETVPLYMRLIWPAPADEQQPP